MFLFVQNLYYKSTEYFFIEIRLTNRETKAKLYKLTRQYEHFPVSWPFLIMILKKMKSSFVIFVKSSGGNLRLSLLIQQFIKKKQSYNGKNSFK